MIHDIAVECFIKAAELGSFTKAAEQMFMARQAVSRQIASLEQALKVKLFNREAASVELTEAGHAYYAFFMDASEQWKQTTQRLRMLYGREAALHIGVIINVDPQPALARVMACCLDESTPFEFQLTVYDSDELHSRLADGYLDVAIDFEDTAFHAAGVPVSMLPVTTLKWMVAARSSLLESVRMDTKKILNTRCFFCVPECPSEKEAQQRFDTFCRQKFGVILPHTRALPDHDSVYYNVVQGQGIALVNSCSSLLKVPFVTGLPLGKKEQLVAVWRKNNTKKSLCAFVEKLAGNTVLHEAPSIERRQLE